MKYIILILIFITTTYANVCSSKLFTFKNDDDSVSLYKFLNVLLVDNCHLNIVYDDDLVKKRVKKLKLDTMSVKDYSLKQLLDLIISGNNLFYTIKDDKLEISYIKTKTFNIDYISSIRSGSTTFKASSSGNTGDLNSIDSKYEFNFWDNLQIQLDNILHPMKYTKIISDDKLLDYISIKANTNLMLDPLQMPNLMKPPIINKNAGLVTITATKRQLDRVGKYIAKLNERLHKQILIDVKIYSVNLSKSNQTGINWSNLNFSLGSTRSPASTAITTSNIVGSGSIFSQSVFNVSGLLNFLATQGNVNSISNPKIATINNQKAIISVGDTINYRYPTKVTADANGNIYTEYAVESKFVGILLDITPEVSENGIIMLRINPTISSFRDESQINDPNRALAPDTTDNKLSTVIRIKDGQTLILGGLITKKSVFSENGVPILKEIPLIKYAFSSKSEISSRRELVFVVTPHIVDLNKKKTLQDLGF